MKRQEQHAQLLTLETGAHRGRSPSAEARESQAEAGHHVRPRCSGQRSNRVITHLASDCSSMRRLPTPCIARMRVISRNALLNTAVYRLQPSYWKTRSDSRKRAKTQPNRLLRAAYYWQSERAGCQDSSVAAGNFFSTSSSVRQTV